MDFVQALPGRASALVHCQGPRQVGLCLDTEARRAENVGTEENKAVVRRFIEDVVSGRDVDVADDVLAPGYVNIALEASTSLA
jgi:hypothetical protein